MLLKLTLPLSASTLSASNAVPAPLLMSMVTSLVLLVKESMSLSVSEDPPVIVALF
jgi:hypothetical protein